MTSRKARGAAGRRRWRKGEDGGGDGERAAGPRNPWAQPPGGNAARPWRRPTALDDLLRRARRRRRRRRRRRFQFPRRRHCRAIWGSAPGYRLLAWVVFTSFHLIGPQERGVVTCFGRFSGTLEPGIRLTLPAPFARSRWSMSTGIRDDRISRTTARESVLTGDQNIVDLAYLVRWNVRDPQITCSSSTSPTRRSARPPKARCARRSPMSRSTTRSARAHGDRGAGPAAMQQILDEYHSGIRIQACRSTRPLRRGGRRRVQEVTAAQQQAQANMNNARAYAQQMLARRAGRGRRVRQGLRAVQARPRSHAPAHVLRDDGSGAGQDQQDDRRGAAASPPICRCPVAPKTRRARRQMRPRREPSDERRLRNPIALGHRRAAPAHLLASTFSIVPETQAGRDPPARTARIGRSIAIAPASSSAAPAPG